mgnify:CR=1 FL=1
MATNISKTKMFLIGTATLNVVLIAIGVFLVFTIQNMSSEIVVREQEVAQLDDKKNSIRQFEQLVREIEPIEAQIDGYFIRRENYITFLD